MMFLLQVNLNPVYDGVLSDATLDAFTMMAMTKILGAATAIISGFILLKLAWEYLKYSLNSVNDSNFVGKIFDMTEAARILVLVFLLALYPSLIQSFTGAFRTFNTMTQVTEMTANQAQDVLNKYGYEQLQVSKTEIFGAEHFNLTEKNEGFSWDGFANPPEKESRSAWSFVRGTLDDAIALILNGITHGVSSFIFFGLAAYLKIILKLLIIIGPLSIAMSVLWKEKFMSWFSAFLNTGMVFVMLNILNYLTLNYLMAGFQDYGHHQFDGGAYGDSTSSIWKAVTFNIAIIGAYFSVFKLTALWIGNSLAGSIISKGLGVATAIAGMAIMGAAGGLAGKAVAKGTESATKGVVKEGAKAATKAGASQSVD